MFRTNNMAALKKLFTETDENCPTGEIDISLSGTDDEFLEDDITETISVNASGDLGQVQKIFF